MFVRLKPESPLVSVVIPTYNRADVLPRAIQSVLKQTLTDFEIIIVDDGSQDQTREVVEEFTDSRIRYIRQENQGANAARNHGIKKATGKYISFLDSDDEFHEDHLKQVVNELELEDSGCIGVYTSYRRLSNKKLVHVSTATREQVTFKDIRKENMIGGFSVVTFRATVFQRVGHLDEQLQCAQDYDFYIRALYDGGYITGVPEYLVDQHTDGTRISSDIQRKRAGLERIVEKHGEKLAESRLADHHYMIGFIHARDGDLASARSTFWRAVCTYPYDPFYYYHLIFSLCGEPVFNKSLEIKKNIKVLVKSKLQ